MSAGPLIRFAHAGVLILSLCALGGCPGGFGDPNDPNNATAKSASKLVRFESQEELLQYLRERARPSFGQRRNLFFFGGATAGVAEDSLAPNAAEDQASDGDSTDFSSTNLQELGVDEADVFKSDGEYFYLARYQELTIIRAFPQDQLAVVARLTLDDPIDQMYLYNDTIITVGVDYRYDLPYADEVAIAIWPPYNSSAKTVIQQIDVADPANPTVLRRAEFDGSSVSSRLTNDRLIIVATIAPRLGVSRGIGALQGLTLEEIMPKLSAAGETRDLVEWSDVYRPDVPDGYFMTAVTTLDAANIESVLDSVAIIANAGTIYASRSALYVSDTTYDENDNFREQTVVHKFAFDDNGVAAYAATGDVPGRPLNQFSLGEHQGYLRIATHIEPTFFFGDDVVGIGSDVAVSSPPEATAQNADEQPTVATNAVYVLGENAGDLAITGAIENIAPGERIYSARFMGARGYLVTFRQIDPLFTIDFTDPANPRLRGELKVPGYSDYLHPLDENHLLGIGRSVVVSQFGARPDAIQVSLFDVSDLDNPQVIDQLEIGGPDSYSEVSYDHKAFAILPNGRFAIPVQIWDTFDSPVVEHFDGVFVMQADATDGIRVLAELEAAAAGANYFGYYYGGWRRPSLIGDTIYCVGPDGVSAAPVDDTDAKSEVVLEAPALPEGDVDKGGGTEPGFGG